MRYHSSSQLQRQHFCMPCFLVHITGRRNCPCGLQVKSGSGHHHALAFLSYRSIKKHIKCMLWWQRNAGPCVFTSGNVCCLLFYLAFCRSWSLPAQVIFKTFPRPRPMHHSSSASQRTRQMQAAYKCLSITVPQEGLLDIFS